MTENIDGPSSVAGIFDVQARGHPFSGSERKPLAWYEVFLAEVMATLVVDFTPASGCDGSSMPPPRRPVRRRLSYRLTNILNKAAVECITRNGSPLFQQDLASCIKDHFKEVIDELHQQDAAVADESAGEESNDSAD